MSGGDGVPLQGLTSYNWGPEDIRSHFSLFPQASGGERGFLYVEAAINGMFGLGDFGGKPKENMGLLRHARLIVRDRAVWDLLWDFTTIKEMAENLPAAGPHGGKALAVANEMVNAVQLGEPETYAAARHCTGIPVGWQWRAQSFHLSDRTCPCRNGMAVAYSRDKTKVLPHFCHGGAADGRLS